MMTVARVRQLALSFPETQEQSHHGTPDFRVGGKIFATLHTEDRVAVLRLDKMEQSALVEARPDIYARAWGTTGWTSVQLPRVPAAEFRELMTEAWRGAAPKRLAAAFDAGESTTARPRATKG
jgi:hypothetical protein